MLELTLVIVGVLVLSGFFSGSEAALLTISEAEVEAMKQAKHTRHRFLIRVSENLSRAVMAIVIMNNAVNIVGSIFVGQMVITLYGNAMLAITTTALTFGVIIFSEIIPKTLGMHYAHVVSVLCAPIIYVITILLWPLIIVFEHITNALKRGGERKVGTEDQIRSLVTIGRRDGHIETDEGHLIHRAFILNDKQAKDIMTDLKDIIALQSDDTIDGAWEKIDHEAYSRYPVYGNSVHEVIGLAFKQDVLEALHNDQHDQLVTTILRDVLIVESDTPSDELITLFRDQHKHLAVVQEDDHTVGLVTLEDVLEELVGDIEDETDVEGG